MQEPQQQKPEQALHIWEQPLPQPGTGTSTGNPEYYQGTFPTIPCQGTGSSGNTTMVKPDETGTSQFMWTANPEIK